MIYYIRVAVFDSMLKQMLQRVGREFQKIGEHFAIELDMYFQLDFMFAACLFPEKRPEELANQKELRRRGRKTKSKIKLFRKSAK